MLEQKTYKNYKQLCEDMGWSTVRGNTKVKHLKELDSLCKWHKEGNKIVIDEIYSQPAEEDSCRTLYDNSSKSYLEFYIRRIKYLRGLGVNAFDISQL